MIDTLAKVKTMLEGINGYSNKVAYDAFPENQAPALPFIVYRETANKPFAADNKNYFETRSVTIEYYSRQRNLAGEALVEATLTANFLPFNRSVVYIPDEKCYQTNYEIEV